MYNNKKMSVIAYANGFTLWHYRTQDTIKEVSEDGYFETLWQRGNINDGDIVILNCKDATCIKQFVVKDVMLVQTKELD